MAYEKQNFVNGNPLAASELNHIEDGIVAIEEALDNSHSTASNVFVGVSGEVTYAQFTEAKNAGKACFLYHESRLYVMSGNGVNNPYGGTLVFYAYSPTYNTREKVIINARNTLTHSTVQAAAVPDAVGDTVTREEFNALLSALRNAGYLAT